nr:MAG TPA: hypothetical protein [Bacteriophage sp.]
MSGNTNNDPSKSIIAAFASSSLETGRPLRIGAAEAVC